MKTLNEDILLQKIKQYNEAYRLGSPVIQDFEYDNLVDELYNINPNNEWFNHIEPSCVDNKRKVKLPISMKSLNKVKSFDDLKKWIMLLSLEETDKIVITPKFDGLSLLYDEKSGNAYSRGGSDNEGQDCTEHYKYANLFNGVSVLHYVYGEFVFSRTSWEQHFKNKTSIQTGDEYKSPRNTAAGLLNRDNPCGDLKYVDFFRYGTDDDSLKQFKTYTELFIYLCKTFEQPLLYENIEIKDVNEDLLFDLYNKWKQSYYIDGIVIYIDNLSAWSKIGRQKNTGNPKYAIAYKNPKFTDTFETTVKDIIWKISKSGALKPVVNIDTVDVGECKIENPTGYNAKYIFDNNIGENAKITITRSGDVIPKILKVITPASKSTMQKIHDKLITCPKCGLPTTYNDSAVELCCTNKQCAGIILAKIIFFYNTVGVENVGEETINKMFNAGFNTLNKMLNIKFEELMNIDGFGKCLANTIIDNNKRINAGIDIAVAMQASDCFQGIGQIKANKILSEMSADEKQSFIEMTLSTIPKDELVKTQNYINGSKTMQSFMLGVKPFFEFIKDNNINIISQRKNIQTNEKYKNMKVCFTGIRDRELEKVIISGGGNICDSVTKSTTHLIVADKNSSSNKIKMAKRFGITAMTISEFKNI